MQVPYNFQQVIANNQYQVINGVKCFPVNMLDENFNYICKVVNVGSTTPTISYDGQFWFDGTTLKIAQSSSWVDIKVANAVNADKLGGLLPSQFLRADQDTTCSGNITAQQFISQITTSPPLVVSSNQLVTNLCADYVDGYHVDSTGAVTGQLVQFDTANVKLSAAPIYVVSGSVGVGITSPTQKLHVGGNIGIQAGANAFIGTVDNYNLSIRTNNTDRISINTSGSVVFYGTAANQPKLNLNTVSTSSYSLVGFNYIVNGNWIGGLCLDQSTNNISILQITGGSQKSVAMFPYSTSTAEGQLTVYFPDPVHNAHKSDFPSGWYGGLGTYNITCSGIYYDTLTQRSDANLKTDVQPLSDYLQTDCLDVISCLKPIKYAYVDDPLKVNRFGFIAQDVSEVCPELVTVDTEGKASLNYMDLIALLTKGIQELYDMLGKVIQKIGGIS